MNDVGKDDERSHDYMNVAMVMAIKTNGSAKAVITPPDTRAIFTYSGR